MRPRRALRKLAVMITEVSAMIQQECRRQLQLHDAIRAALLSRCSKAADRVRIDNDPGGWVTIEGEVEDWNERQRVEKVVASVPGVTRVDCRLIVDV
jgi:osmotically-inducible protein OsmY